VATAQRVRPARHGRDDAEPVAGFDAELAGMLERAEASARRADPPLAGQWRVDLPPAEPHLAGSVRRALAQLPAKPGSTARAEVTDWTDIQRAVAREAAELILRVWPAMYAELAAVLRQVALLAGPSINGFTDFATHGVAYLNRDRLDDGPDGLPARNRLAEALVHEATHNRCNVASLTTRFLVPDPAGARRFDTPLRADPRPMSGLFQQLVVIARGVRLHDLCLEQDPSNGDGHGAVRCRRDELVEQGNRGLAVIDTQVDALSESGLAVMAQVRSLLRAGARLAPVRPLPEPAVRADRRARRHVRRGGLRNRGDRGGRRPADRGRRRDGRAERPAAGPRRTGGTDEQHPRRPAGRVAARDRQLRAAGASGGCGARPGRLGRSCPGWRTSGSGRWSGWPGCRW
jgi:hypothetical protein